VNFARTGDPNGKGLPVWRPFAAAEADPAIIGDAHDAPDPKRLAMYDRLYARILTGLKP
jgi:hypothetical protein